MDGVCSHCRMPVKASEFHPYIACLAMKQSNDENTVQANLRWVVEYGMRAERAGISLDEAMTNFNAVEDPPER